MNFEKRVALAYQYVLKDLNSANKYLITALTMLALDDIEYYEAIVETIVQHTLSVRNTYYFLL